MSVDEREPLLRALASFRYALRQFLHFSEDAAHSVGLQPQQHQLLLQVAGAQAGSVSTIAYVAERLGLKHNSVVELVDRCAAEGLLERHADPGDRRKVVLQVTGSGRAVLARLSEHHARELNDLRPRLMTALEQIALPADRAADRDGAQPAARGGKQ